MTTEPVNPSNPNDELVRWEDSVVGSEPLTFGDMLWSFREGEALNQADIARRLGISRQLLNAYETGRKLPSIELAYRMAETLGMSANLTVLLVVNEHIARHNLPIKLALAS